MWSRGCDELSQAGYKVTYRPPGRYSVGGIAENIGIREVNKLAEDLERGRLKGPKKSS